MRNTGHRQNQAENALLLSKAGTFTRNPSGDINEAKSERIINFITRQKVVPPIYRNKVEKPTSAPHSPHSRGACDMGIQRFPISHKKTICQAHIVTTKTMCSLRWHYPNQVMGQSNTAYSQPAYTSSPSSELPLL